jgi:hypothetical protein
MRFTIYDLRFTRCLLCESGAEAAAVQTLPRVPDAYELREASGLRPLQRRFFQGSSTM